MSQTSYNVKFDLDKIRNIGIIAHIDAGKTTTTERLLFFTGQVHKIGEVHEGEAVTDFMEQERERGITIMSAAVTCFWKWKGGDYRVNIIDTPGHVDFTAEVERSLRVLDGAVVLLDGKMGVEPQTETVWRQATKYGVPRICFVNKLNLLGGDFEASFESIKQRLSDKAVMVSLPMGREQQLYGMVDLIKMKAYTYDDINDLEMKEQDIPEEYLEKAQQKRAELVEAIVSLDDVLMEKFFAGDDISEEELLEALRKGVLAKEIYPVMGGDSRTAVVKKLLDLVTATLPSPQDVGDVVGEELKTGEELRRKPLETEPFSSLVFKVVNDPHIGTLSYFRVYSGKVSAGSYVYNSTKDTKERIGRLVLMHAEDREEVTELRAGDIGAIVGLKDSVTGDTLCDESDPVLLEAITFSEPVISMAIEPKTKSDEEKLGVALGRLVREDPTFKVQSNPETGQTIVSGMGELHLEIQVDRLKREFKIEANIGQPQVAYRETIRKVREQEARYVKQSGGKGQYGHCYLRLEPNEAGEGFEFIDEIKGGAIPREFIPAVRKGVEEVLTSGVVAGYPVVDVKVALYDGSYHDVDSSEASFKVAGSMAFKEGMKNADPVLLEPVMNVEVSTPEEYLGDVTGSLSSKRGIVESTDVKHGAHLVKAKVPLAELFGYTTEIRSLTSGRGAVNMEMSHYAEVPKSVASEITSSDV